MNEQPTPETDEAWPGHKSCDIEFARKLERERDEAREALWYLADALGVLGKPYDLEGYGITSDEAVWICRIAELGKVKQ